VNSNPLGQYGNLVASILAVIIVLSAIASHVVPGLVPDAWLDSAALVAVGVVFGTQVTQNGTQAKAASALALAKAAHDRLNAIGAPAQRASDAATGIVAPPDPGSGS
jgi:hypothetical protein